MTVKLVEPNVLTLSQPTTTGSRVAVLNFGDAPLLIALDLDGGRPGQLLISTNRRRTQLDNDGARLPVGPLEGLILQLDR